MTSQPSILIRARRYLIGGVGAAAVGTVAFAVAAAHHPVATGSQGTSSPSTDSGTTSQNVPDTSTGQYQGYDQSSGSGGTSDDGATGQDDGGSSGLSSGQGGSSDGSSHAS